MNACGPRHDLMTTLTFYGGVGEIGGNQILLGHVINEMWMAIQWQNTQ